MKDTGWNNTDSMVLQILATMLAGQNREQQAADLLEYVLGHEPDNLDVIKALCGVYLILDRHEDALDMADRYEQNLPPGADPGPVMMVKGQALWELGHSREAMAAMDSYLQRKGTP